MTLQQLRYVTAIAETGTLSEAARRFYIAQPSLTASLRELEEELGLTIFRRTNRGAVVTPEGEEFLGYARQVLAQMDLMEEKYLGAAPVKHQFCVSTQHYSFAVEAFVEMLMDGRKKALDAKQASVKRALAKQDRRITELDTIIQKLYEDNVCGKLTDERFAKLSAGYEQEQAELTTSVQTLRKELAAAQESTGNAEKFLRLVRKYTEPKELTTVMVHELIDKIIVHAPDKSSGERIQQIDIRYNFIGEVEFSAEYATRTTA